MTDLLPWIDIETLGLDATSPILEVGIVVTNIALEVKFSNKWLVWSDNTASEVQYMQDHLTDENQFVLNMHSENGLLISAAQTGLLPTAVENKIISFMRDNKIEGLPMCGSSVHSDRMWLKEQMPRAEQMFHYRNIDTSTIKELCRRYNPRVYEHLPPKQERHRVLPDLKDTIEEFRHYRDEFLLW